MSSALRSVGLELRDESLTDNINLSIILNHAVYIASALRSVGLESRDKSLTSINLSIILNHGVCIASLVYNLSE